MSGEVNEASRAFRLDGRVVVITGAGSGLGREAARIFALAGARPILADINEQGMKATAAAIPGDRSLSFQVDISDRNAVEALADQVVKEAGRLDVWVNCAGIGYMHSILDTDPDRAARVLKVNVMGTFWCCAAAGRVMRDHGGGAIVNVSSGGGSTPVPGVSIYGMSKAAVNSLTWTSAAEFGPYGIRVNALAPGWIDTPMSATTYTDSSGRPNAALREKTIATMKKYSPLGIVGEPSDIALGLLYLSSDASRFVTGQILSVHGGASMG
jgi:3-oxoacyl-[acyl-carrier protein] reductase